MIQIYLHELIPLNPPKRLIPAEVRGAFAVVAHGIDPRVKLPGDGAREDVEGEWPPVEVETGESDIPRDQDGKGPVDYTELAKLADWCRENEEPWLERALRFVVKHKPAIHRLYTYGTIYRWDFDDKTMPNRWRYLNSTSTDQLEELFAVLAAEIKKRYEELEA